MPADSEALVFQYGYAFNGLRPTTVAPWLTATFTQKGTNNVLLIFQFSLEASSELFTQIALNLRPDTPRSAMAISCSGGGDSEDRAATAVDSRSPAPCIAGSGSGNGRRVPEGSQETPAGRKRPLSLALPTLDSKGALFVQYGR